MKRSALLVIALALGGGCVHDALLSVTPGIDEFPGAPTTVPRDGPLGQEIQAGYRAYGPGLARFGQWTTDPTYGVRFCPAMSDRPGALPFVPYVSAGHWAPAESVTTPHGALPADTPYWVADASLPWADVTMHHGWWVNDARAGRWCWIPGTEEVAARVFWRESDGFVAWAPAPPPDESGDADEGDDDLLAWVYEFTGTLFDGAVEQLLLRGEAADAAEEITRDARARDRFAGHKPVGHGPSRGQVGSARSALSEYTGARPSVGSSVAASASANGAHGAAQERPPLPRPSEIYSQLARDTARGEGRIPAHSAPSDVTHDVLHGLPHEAPQERVAHASLPVLPSGGSHWGSGHAFNSYAGHAGTNGGAGCDCGSHQGGHSSSTSSSGNSHAGHAGTGGGGDCGSHGSTHHK